MLGSRAPCGHTSGFPFSFFNLVLVSWAFTAVQGLLLVAVSRGYPSLQRTGLSCYGAQALGAWASVVASLRLSSTDSWALVAPQHVDSSWTSDRTSDAELADRFLTTGPPGKSHTPLAS